MINCTRVFKILLAISVGLNSGIIQASTTTSLTSPTDDSGTNFPPGTTLSYNGTVTWGNTDSSIPQYVEVNWTYGMFNTYDLSVVANSIGIGDSESANIPSSTNVSLKFQSASFTDTNGFFHAAVPLNCAQVSGKQMYYYVVATPTMEGHAPILQGSQIYDVKGNFICKK